MEPSIEPSSGTAAAAPPPGPSAAARPVRWGLGDAWLGLLIANGVAVIASPLIIQAAGYHLDESDTFPLALIAVLQLPLWAGYLTMPVVAARFKGNGLVADFGLRVRALDVPLGVAVGLVLQLIVVPLIYVPIFWVIGHRDVSAVARDLTDRADDAVGVVLLILIVVVAAPIVEELFFRGLLLRALENRVGTTWGVLISGLIFGAVHLEPLQFPALVAVGVVFALLAVRTGRLGPSIFAHMTFNGIAVASLLASR